MTQEAFNQIIEAARHGDVFAQTALGIMLCEGKIVQPNRDHGLGWLGLIDDAAALTFIYNKLEDKVTPDVQRRVQDTVDEWFGVEYEVIEA